MGGQIACVAVADSASVKKPGPQPSLRGKNIPAEILGEDRERFLVSCVRHPFFFSEPLSRGLFPARLTANRRRKTRYSGSTLCQPLSVSNPDWPAKGRPQPFGLQRYRDRAAGQPVAVDFTL